MNTTDFTEAVMRRYTTAQSPAGRWGLNQCIWLKRLAWRWLIGGSRFTKRAFDIVGSLVALLLLAPLFLLIAVLIKLEDGDPVVFAQTRVGRRGREFSMFKFRSMCHNAEQRLREVLQRNQHSEGVTFKLKDDPRITRVGRWLRRFSFDELPQFYNVLIGDMSLVGPRPPLPREVARYSLADRRRLETTPGITCFWQISGRSELDFSRQVQLDVQYIENRTLWVDVKILAKTAPAVLSGTGAY